VRECWAELGRVQWPNRGQLWQATAVVILACFVVGVYLYALDSVFTRAAEWLIRQQAG
jgi:preprotein translocase subunit SecE